MSYLRFGFTSLIVVISMLAACGGSSTQAQSSRKATQDHQKQSPQSKVVATDKVIAGTPVPFANAAKVIKWRSELHPESHAGMDTLIQAASTGDNVTIQKLIDRADRDTGGNNRDTPRFQNEFHSRDAAGWNALHHVAFNNKTTTLSILLSLKALEPDWKTGSLDNSHGLNPWDAAPADANDRGLSALHIAAMEGNLEVVKIIAPLPTTKAGRPLEAKPIDPATYSPWDKSRMAPADTPVCDNDRQDIEGLTPLDYAIIFDRTEVINYLLDRGSSLSIVDKRECAPIMVAVDSNHLNLVKLLVNRGAVVSVRDNDRWGLLHHSAATNDVECAIWLMDEAHLKKDDADAEGGVTPLHLTAVLGHLSVMALLLDRGCLVDDWDASKATPLHYAALGNQAEAIEFLIKRGANVNATEQTGYTPLIIAAEKNNIAAVAALLAAKPQIDAVTGFGGSALMLAVLNGHVEASEQLLKAGASLTAKTPAGDSLLHLAAMSGSTRLVEILLAKDLPINAVNQSNQTPLDLAVANAGAADVVRLLRSRGGTQGTSP